MSHQRAQLPCLFLAMMPLLLASAANATTPETMMAACRDKAHHDFRLRLPDIETKYEGQRTDGTHAVNGTAWVKDGTRTFQCSFNKAGTEIVDFVINETDAAPGNDVEDATVEGTEFHATGEIPCARTADAAMSRCKFGVVREGGGNGYVKIFWPVGGSRVIFFEDLTPVRFDQSEADGDATMSVDKDSDLYKIKIGTARFEIPEVVIAGD